MKPLQLVICAMAVVHAVHQACWGRYRKEQKLTYFDIYRKAKEIDPTLTEAEWDAIMYSEGEDS